MREEGVVGRGGEGKMEEEEFKHTHTHTYTHLFILSNLVSVMSPTVSGTPCICSNADLAPPVLLSIDNHLCVCVLSACNC